ncbi:MAG: hypothetical protein M5R36_07810 [Deltaproteobacteria bacterium]|nr:hypothetical protein [Deltaproteobacteria bacterium]
MTPDQGKVYTKGASYRARAEARQREYRANVARAGWSEWGHLLDDVSADAGANFVVPEAHQAARDRHALGKGVAVRTFNNMLSSQAMCFNVFAPLAADTNLASRVLRGFAAGLETVEKIHFEYTPAKDLFRDQSGRGGVDCDLLIEGTWKDGRRAVVTIETKFVEPEFSVCGFRKSGRTKNVCRADLVLDANSSKCLYATEKKYGYWEQTHKLGQLRDGLLPGPCPFGSPLWQLWVNHTLAFAEASRRRVPHAAFGVCAPAGNEKLLNGGRVLDLFRSNLKHPSSFFFIPLDDLIGRIRETCGHDHKYRPWRDGLAARYAAI